MNTSLVLVVFALASASASCAPSVREEARPEPVAVAPGGGGDEVGGGVSRAEAAPVLEDAKAQLVALDANLAEEEDADARVAMALDRTALASFVADLEACVAGGRACPSSLEEPSGPPSAAEWPAAAEALAGGACACRTHACATLVLDELARWNDRLDPAALDEAAGAETRARECAARRLGR